MSENDLSIQIQPRDLLVFRGLLESRIMTLRHIANLHFENNYEYAKKRLQQLKASSLVAERRRRVNEPSILFLTRQAFKILETDGILSEYPPLGISLLEKRTQVAESTIRHELEVLDIKAAVSSALRAKPNFSVTEFSTWPRLNEFRAAPASDHSVRSIKPDGFIHIQEQQGKERWNYRYFLEHDRSTETQDTLALKCACYTNYYRTGGFALRNGRTRDEYSEVPFRVLVVLKNAERRNNTAERLLQMNPPILTQVYLSTLGEVKADPLGKIWIRPADYRDITSGTAFDPEKKTHSWIYRRQIEREMLVEKNIVKHSLLAD